MTLYIELVNIRLLSLAVDVRGNIVAVVARRSFVQEGIAGTLPCCDSVSRFAQYVHMLVFASNPSGQDVAVLGVKLNQVVLHVDVAAPLRDEVVGGHVDDAFVVLELR